MRFSIIMKRLTLVFLLAVVLGGCGKKAPPIPPDSLVPGDVRNFTVRQDGQALLLQWLIPRVNIAGQPLTDIQGFQILRSKETGFATAGCPPELQTLARIDMAFPQAGKVEGEQVTYRDDALEPGYRYFYQVQGFDHSGHLGTTSPVASHAWDILPQPPAKLAAQAGDRQVNLAWSPVNLLANGQPLPGAATYNVYRAAGGGEFSLINQSPVNDTNFQDITVANDVSYRYLMRTVRQGGRDTLESLNSMIQTATPVDQTPPAPVLNLVAVSTPKGLELRWDAGREPDLAGYQVHRRSDAEPQFRLLTPKLLKQPYFVDQETTRGATYYYYVVAVDNAARPNQSFPSETVAVIR